MAASSWVVNVTVENFQEQVVAASHKRPVVIDFWAPWCGPCRRLAPLLEALAVERDGGFLLAKINSDNNPELAQAFQVDGIPAVYAMRNGTVVSQFTGLLPEEQLREFIDGLSPSEAEKQAGTALGLEGRDPMAAAAAYRGMLATNPDEPAARVGLARVLLTAPGNEAEAAKLLTGIESGEHAAEAARLKTVVAFRGVAHTDTELNVARATVRANPGDAQANHWLGSILAARGEYEAALDALLAAAEADKEIGRGSVRELMIKVFEVIGPRSPEADAARNKLRMLLY